MTTDRQQRANRTNAKSSTGPKTATGKARSAQNALRHGLNLSVLSDPALEPQVEVMARKIAGRGANAEVMERARRIAEAQVDLNRVRDCRRRLFLGFSTDPNYHSLQVLRRQLRVIETIYRVGRLRGAPFEIDDVEDMISPRPLEGEQELAAILGERVSQLAALDQYERRAWSRRKFAIRRFDVARVVCRRPSVRTLTR